MGLRLLTGDLTGQMHEIPRVCRGPYGFTGKMTPGGVSLSLSPLNRNRNRNLGFGDVGVFRFPDFPLSPAHLNRNLALNLNLRFGSSLAARSPTFFETGVFRGYPS